MWNIIFPFMLKLTFGCRLNRDIQTLSDVLRFFLYTPSHEENEHWTSFLLWIVNEDHPSLLTTLLPALMLLVL